MVDIMSYDISFPFELNRTELNIDFVQFNSIQIYFNEPRRKLNTLCLTQTFINGAEFLLMKYCVKNRFQCFQKHRAV